MWWNDVSFGLKSVSWLLMKKHDDQKYIEAFRAGDFSGMEQLYAAHAAKIRSWIVKNNGTTADAQDVFQEALMALHKKAQDKSFVLTCPIGALLFQICRNKWLNQLRQKKQDAKVRNDYGQQYKTDNSQIQPLIEQVEEEEIRQQKLDQTFAKLSTLCRKLLQLLSSGISSSEAALQLGMANANTLYRRRHACVERWRTLYNAIK